MLDKPPFRPSLGTRVFFGALALVGCAAVAFGLSSDAQRTWTNLFVAANYLIWLATGALTFMALDAVTGARWSLPLRRLQEACVAVLPAACLVLLAALLLAPSLYRSGNGAEAEHPSALRSLWLQKPLLLGRAVAYQAVWLTFAAAMVQAVRNQERVGALLWSPVSVRLGAAFLVAFGGTCWLASYDWIMALEPGWSSTIFGVYNFAGAILSALAALSLLASILARVPSLRARLTTDCLHDLGTLLFSFSSFWMYIWYCQYLLIWYTNHPAETSYFRERTQGVWLPVLLAALVLNWAIPFVVLLPRRNKQSASILACVAIGILIGRWLDLLVMIGPSQGDALAIVGPLDVGIALGAVGVAGLSALWSLTGLPLAPGPSADLLPDHTLGIAPASK
jgi:hypothetical protein